MHRWLVDPAHHSEIAKIARELASSSARRLVLQGSSSEQWAEAALEIEGLLRLLRSSVHRRIRSAGDARPLWDLSGSEIRDRLDSLSHEDRAYVVRNGDRFWPDLPDPRQAEFVNDPQRLDELARVYLGGGSGESRTLEWNLVMAGLMAGEQSIRAELTRGRLDSSPARALLALGAGSVAIGGVLGWLTSSSIVFVLVAAGIGAAGYSGLRRRRRALEGLDPRLDKVGRALAQLHGLSDDGASDGFEYREALSAITQPATFLPWLIARLRARAGDSIRSAAEVRPMARRVDRARTVRGTRPPT